MKWKCRVDECVKSGIEEVERKICWMCEERLITEDGMAEMLAV